MDYLPKHKEHKGWVEILEERKGGPDVGNLTLVGTLFTRQTERYLFCLRLLAIQN
jgi:hypothetical protein